MSPTSRQSRAVCHGIKLDRLSNTLELPLIEYVVSRLARDRPPDVLDALGPDRVLVPVPKSAPSLPSEPNALWVPLRICQALMAAGFGAGTALLLERVSAVPKSAFAAAGQRPSLIAQYESLSVRPGLVTPTGITLVDDVVTKGATFLAAASRVHEVYPATPVGCLALVRTCGLVPDIDQIVDPVSGRICRTPAGDVDRQP